MSDTTFRSQSETTEVVQESMPEAHDPNIRPVDDKDRVDVKTPIALYPEIEGKPYSAVYFDVKGIWDDPNINIKNDLLAIDEAYKKMVQDKKLEDGEESYKAFIKQAEKVTDTKYSERLSKVKKIAEYVRFMDRLMEIDKNDNEE